MVVDEKDLGLLLGAGGLLGQEDGLDVGQDAALGDGDAGQQLVQLLVVADGELDVARDDALLLVVRGPRRRGARGERDQADVDEFSLSNSRTGTRLVLAARRTDSFDDLRRAARSAVSGVRSRSFAR